MIREDEYNDHILFRTKCNTLFLGCGASGGEMFTSPCHDCRSVILASPFDSFIDQQASSSRHPC